MPKRVLCKFFAQGVCLKGEHCNYSHDWASPSSNVCTFYQKGACSYGRRCRYEHVRPHNDCSSSSSFLFPASRTSSSTVPLDRRPELSADSAPYVRPGKHILVDMENQEPLEGSEQEETPLCSFAVAGDCPRGEKCPHIHGDLCPSCGKHCLHPFKPEDREEHIKSCEKKQRLVKALTNSQEIECSVCLDRVLSKPTASERKFGLLSECDHPFCISCIRNWRNSSPSFGVDVNTAVRACPICRKVSYFVIPSVIWYFSQKEKEEIVDAYKAKLQSIDCKHFDFGNGNCPFGTSCFYKHTVRPGSYTWKYNRPPPRRRRSSHHYNIMDMFELSEFCDLFEHLMEADLDISEFDDYEDSLEDIGYIFMHSSIGLIDSSSDEESYGLGFDSLSI